MTLFLADLAAGDMFRSAAHRIDAEQIIRFAQEFDPQPFHLHARAARGCRTTAIAMRRMAASIPLAGGPAGRSPSEPLC